MALTEQQIQALLSRCNSISAPQLCMYIKQADSQQAQEDLLERMKAKGLSQEKFQWLWDQIHQPSPEEQKDWADIEAAKNSIPQAQLKQRLESYISKWEKSNPAQNHIENARRLISAMSEEIDWNNLDKNNYSAILAYLAKYTHSAHFQELDDIMWSLVDIFSTDSLSKFMQDMPNSIHLTEASNLLDDAAWNAIDHTKIGDLQMFIATNSNSRHRKEAEDIIASYAKWNEVQESGDIFVVKQYINDYPSSPFKQNAEVLMLTLRQQELQKMHELRNLYDPSYLKDLIDEGIFSQQMLINEGLITCDSYSKFINPPTLPDLQMEESITDCKPEHTDVFLFGIPATGKTCILMGLLNSPRLYYSSSIMGGEYAANLQEYAEAGRVPPSTYGTFTTAINAQVTDNRGKKHFINLVEMSGEEFAFQIAKNPNGKISFEEMGSGATQILRNQNKKAVFIILDPTADNRKVRRPIFGFDEYGNKIQTGEEVIYVSQKQMLHKLFDLFLQPENASIARLIDSFHFIVTKADLLGNEFERAEKAKNLILSRHSGTIPIIKSWCQKYGINNGSDNKPKCYPFSLGTFYLGDVFDYDSEDANRLIEVIANCTIGKDSEPSWWDKLRSKLN